MKKQKSPSNPPSRTTRSTPARPSSKPASRRRPTAAKKVTAVIHEPFTSEFSSSVHSATPTLASSAPSPERQGGASRGSEPPPSVRKLDAAAAANYRQAYAAARVVGPDGRVRLDEARFAQALADLRVDPLVEQDLYTWALLAAADGDAALFSDEGLELRSA
jgi:hypothetical protein